MNATMRLCLPFVLILLSGCARDETLAAYGAGERLWTLQEINGTAFAAQVTLAFAPDGVVTGNAPCNSFSARQNAPYPWFELAEIKISKTACPALAQEQAFFNALSGMSLAEVAGEVLILSNDAGHGMIFRSF